MEAIEHSPAPGTWSPVFALLAKIVSRETLPFIPLFQKQAGVLSSKQLAEEGRGEEMRLEASEKKAKALSHGTKDSKKRSDHC